MSKNENVESDCDIAMSVDELSRLAEQMHSNGQYQKAADLRACALQKLRDAAKANPAKAEKSDEQR
jgi:hypothetical protein